MAVQKTYVVLGSTILTQPDNARVILSDKLNDIPTFEYEISNNSANRTTLGNLNQDVKIYRASNNSLLFTGRIEGDDSIEYVSRRRIKISGYHKMIDLSHAFFLRLSASGILTPTSIRSDDGGAFTNETTDGTNATINDVSIPITAVNDAFYIGHSKTFNVIKIKYSTKGVYSATVVWEYYNGSSWAALECLDDTLGFTRNAGTRYLIIPNEPATWAAVAVNGATAYYVRMRVSAWTSATTQPLADQVWVGDEDIARIQYDNIAANSILQDLIDHANTQYSTVYTISECPSTVISLRGEYDSHLNWISEIAAALTWTDGNGDKHEYDWWLDGSAVHIKTRRETFLEGAPYDVSAKLQVLDRKETYKIGNRIFGLGYGDGINQLRNIREHAASQVSYGVRDVMFSDLRIMYLDTLNSKGDTLLGQGRAPAITFDCSLRTVDFLDAGLVVGDWLKVHQAEWNATNAVIRLVGFDMGADSTKLELSNEMSSISSLIRSLNRSVDVLNKSMQGATNIYQFNYLDNFQNTKPITMYVYIPAKAKIINDVRLNYRVLQYRADSSIDGAGAGATSGNGTSHQHVLPEPSSYPGTQDIYLMGVAPTGTNKTWVGSGGNVSATTYSESASHTHSIPSHTHAQSFGIVESSVTLPTVTINIGGTDRFTALAGDQTDLDITLWMATGWNTLIFTPSSGATPAGIGRIQIDGFVQCFIESR